MFLLTKPSPATIDSYAQKQGKLELSYTFGGATHPQRYSPPLGYTLDHNRVCLGTGEAVFKRAVTNLEHWQMYHTGWTFIQTKTLHEGMCNSLLAKHFGFYSLHVLKVIYIVREARHVAFSVGTLPGHAQQGEERFLVEWLADDSV
jgi:uncharacterized protein (UPF0548 family)